MKKLSIVLMLALIPVILFAQDPDVPPDTTTLLSALLTYFLTPAGVAGVIIFITEILVRKIKITTDWIKIALAWVVSIIVVSLAKVLTFGFLGELVWIEVAAWGVGFGFIANLFADVPTVKTIIGFLMSIIKLKKPV